MTKAASSHDIKYIKHALKAPEFGGMLTGGIHWFPVRVYYEDTDAGGIVYYANYLKFMERSRTEMLGKANLTSNATLHDKGLGYVVRKVELDYLRPAYLEDMLVVKTWISAVKAASVVMSQVVFRNEDVLVRGDVQIACLDLKSGGRPVRLPEDFRAFYHRFKDYPD